MQVVQIQRANCLSLPSIVSIVHEATFNHPTVEVWLGSDDKAQLKPKWGSSINWVDCVILANPWDFQSLLSVDSHWTHWIPDVCAEEKHFWCQPWTLGHSNLLEQVIFFDDLMSLLRRCNHRWSEICSIFYVCLHDAVGPNFGCWKWVDGHVGCKQLQIPRCRCWCQPSVPASIYNRAFESNWYGSWNGKTMNKYEDVLLESPMWKMKSNAHFEWQSIHF